MQGTGSPLLLLPCAICQEAKDPRHGGSRYRGCKFVCNECVQAVRKWTKWTEAQVVEAFGGQPWAAANAFYLTNRLRRAENARVRGKRTKLIMNTSNTSPLKKRRFPYFRPMLRRSEMAKLGVSV